jgi:Arc/MetJ-type ribon-helix-helix transcriptional regulator
MSSELSPENERWLEQIVGEGGFASRREALDRAMRLLREEVGTLDDIREGLASIERGEGTPLEEVAAEMRAKFEIRDDV